ncbi:hypothetical protein Tco_0377251 [Tanacetum coccineum]
MAEPNDYITATQKNFISNDNEGRMVKIYIIKVQGTFLVKICDDAFNRNVGENVFKHIDKFLEVVGLIKISGLTQDRFRLSVFPVLLAGAASEWFTNECIVSITTWDNMVEKFWTSTGKTTRVLVESECSRDRPIHSHYEASNVRCTQENHGHKSDPIPKPSNCKVRRFEMMKYSFDDDEEYITIKESKTSTIQRIASMLIENLYVSLMKDGS